MKAWLVCFIALNSLWARAQPQAASNGPAVTVEVNRTFCLVRFVETLAGSSGTYGGSRRVYEQSHFNTAAARHWLRRYQNLDHEPTFDREGYPSGRLGSVASTAPSYLTASADARDLTDLQRRTVGLLPNEMLLSLDSVYRYFDPVFDTLAWQPHAAELVRLQVAYAQFLAKGELMREFARLRIFYGSVWPNAIPYRIQLNPQLDAGTGFTNKATVTGNLVLLDCHPTSRDFVAGSAVVFHEMSHSLSVQQRRGLQQQLEGWYLRNPSPNARSAYNLMEEALATTAGEWIYEQQTGRPETGDWYDDDYINRHAQALYPLVKGYVGRGRTIDSAFVREAIALFDRAFPQAAVEYVNLFRKTLYWSDAEDFQAAVQPFQDQFKSNFTQSALPILHAAKALEQAQGVDYLPVILVTREHAATLRYLRENLPALHHQRLRPEQSFVLSTTGPAGPLILVNAHNPAQLAAAATLLKQQGRIDTKRTVQLLK